jgi:hypothetical protein
MTLRVLQLAHLATNAGLAAAHLWDPVVCGLHCFACLLTLLDPPGVRRLPQTAPSGEDT